MANAYSIELRERVVHAYRRGDGTLDGVARTFSVNPRTVQRWLAHERVTGSLVPKPKAGGWRCPITLPLLHAVIADAPDATIAELCWEYNRRAAATAQTTVTSFGRAMRREGYVLKKNGRGRARSIGRTSGRSARRS